MKKLVVMGLLCWLGLVGQAEAGVGDWVKNSWMYLTTPVNCLVEAGKDVITLILKLGTCVLQNVNRNPTTLDPLMRLP